MILFWIAVFVVSLLVLVKGADFLLGSSEKIGLAAGLSPFVVGVVIVGLGTSFPELISGISAILQGAPEIVAANAIGSNIANILLVVGFSALFARRLSVTKDLIDIEIPLLAVSTVLFVGVAIDGSITFVESLIIFLTYQIYLLYTIFHRDGTEEPASKRPKVTKKDILLLILGVAGLVLGAKYLVLSVISLSEILNIATGAIALAAVALGTSLPELLVSIKAAKAGNAEVALGNIFGSNAFNLLMVVGIPGLFATLPLDEKTVTLGIPVLLASTFLFIVSGISKRIHMWEGAMYLMVYILFIGKLFNLF
ncbi:calcium/sodium antiporter [Candidatus Parcubacteria bacterium]|nr:calcium/sodium antiporter [Candidatus Parcubacteria bacterium]